MQSIACILSIGCLLVSLNTQAADLNAEILQAISVMPKLGGYDTLTAAGIRALERACRTVNGKLVVNPTLAQPSYCTVATYLVFIQAVEKRFNVDGVTGLPDALAVHGEDDGVGIWGRWDANGPATPCLFHELGLGENFTDWSRAKEGDFMKISWNGLVGRDEYGHSAIFMGRRTVNGIDTVSYWSSNTGKGYGINSRPWKAFKFVIFSRLEQPEKIAGATALPRSNPYLSSLRHSVSSQKDALANSGVR